MHALIVEDYPMNACVLSHALGDRFTAHCVDLAADGVAAYQRALDRGTPFDVVFLDLMLPDSSGLTVLEHIRTVERLRNLPPVPVLVVTAVTDLGVAKQIFERGRVAAYLVKPLDFGLLRTELGTIGLIPPG